MLDLLNFLNSNSGAMQGVSTIVLVLITAYYAYQTKRTTAEMSLANKLAVLPVLIMEYEYVPGDPNPWCLVLKNIGNGTAINIEMKVDKSEYKIELYQKVLAPGQKANYKVTREGGPVNPYQEFWSSQGILTITYYPVSKTDKPLSTKIKLIGHQDIELLETNWTI